MQSNRLILMCFAIGSSFVLAGNRPACEDSPPTLTCDVVSINLDPGTCVEIQNPCGDHQWTRLDGFRLCDEPDGLFIQTQRSPRARFFCADARVGTLLDEPVDFFYATPSDTGIGTFRVTIGATALGVVASANPSSVAPGGSSQLDATATGGFPPYTYSWTGSGLSQTNIANPFATPAVSTQYTVVVTDSRGNQASASVIVNVGLAVIALTDAAVINVGQSANLTANVGGGTPPYSFSWSPAASLSASNVANPTASPVNNTTYSVTVTDFFGTTAMASVFIRVNLTAVASANPASILAGAQSQLGVAVQGGQPPYSYSWSPAASLDDSTVQNPVARPTQTTLYNVNVTDGFGTVVSTQVNVSVSAPSLVSCFTLTQLSPISAQANGSCSVGTIVQYRWWADFRFANQPPDATTTSPISPTLLYESPGPHTVRLVVVDNTNATAASTQTFISQ